MTHTSTSPSAPVTGSRQAVALVARREFTTRSRSRVTVVVSIVMLVIIIGFIVVMKFVSGGGPSVSTVGFTDQNAALRGGFVATANAAGQHTRTTLVTDQAAGERQVREGKLDALLTGLATDIQVVVKKDLSDGLRSAITLTVRQAVLNEKLTGAGVDPTAVERAVAATSVHVRPLEATPRDPNQVPRMVVGIIAAVLVYMALMLYGQTVAQGVIEEKASRIVELLLSAIKPWQLMLGKIVGIGAVGLVQFTVIAGAALGTAMGTHVLRLPAAVLTSMAGWALAWFLAGFTMYALLFAAAGALVSRQEDAAGVVSPLVILIAGSYVMGVSILPSNPHASYLSVLSMVPLFSPTLMPMRLGMGAPAWEAWLALGLTLTLIVVLVALTGRVYRNAVLRTGTRVRLRAALRAA